VTSPDVQLALRTPAWARVLAAAFVPGWIGVFFLGVADLDRELPLVGYALPVLAVLFLVWSARVSVVGTADGRLIVRNLFLTLTVPREHVGSVEIDDAGSFTGQGFALFVRTHEDLRFRLDVTQRPFAGQLERNAAALRAWRDAVPQPFL
jgi:hypothetical protein